MIGVRMSVTSRKNGRPWFHVPEPAVSERMRRVKSVGTRLESTMERILRNMKLAYVSQPDLPGKPDFRLKTVRVLIFCDSSFWHGRRQKELSGEAFKKNKAFWIQKLSEDKHRDQQISQKLRREGWSVLRFWDTDILRKPLKVKNKLIRALVKK